jgi:hypothetical protein
VERGQNFRGCGHHVSATRSSCIARNSASDPRLLLCTGSYAIVVVGVISFFEYKRKELQAQKKSAKKKSFTKYGLGKKGA